MTYTIQELRDRGLIIFETVAGSQSYGTNTPESDRDIRGVFVQPLGDVLKYGFVEQVSDETNDVTFYELGRFIDLVIGNNPNIIELLAPPSDCIIYQDPKFKTLLQDNPSEFLSKRVRWTFSGYAMEQINKARGLNKKMNWEESEMTRKTVLDFCYILEDGGSISFKEWLDRKKRNLQSFGDKSTIEMSCAESHLSTTQKDFSLVKIDHAHDVYAMYFYPGGIVSDEEKANDVQLISIPKGHSPVCYLSFNKDGYSSHCKKFKEYQTWLKERNQNRFKMNKAHGKNYDSKNMMHTYRLLLMAHELAEGKLIVRRPADQIERLMSIRKGEYEYDNLLSESQSMLQGLDKAYEESSLPDKVNKEAALEKLFQLRQYYYAYFEQFSLNFKSK